MFDSTLQFTAGDILTLLVILAVMLVIVAMFNVVFMSFSLRKIVRRVDNVTKEAEAVVIKPLQTADAIVDWVMSFLTPKADGHYKKKHKHKDDDVIDV